MGVSESENQKQAEALTMNEISAYRDRFTSDSKKLLMQNVVTRHDVNQVAMQRSVVAEATHSFSTVLDSWKVTNQSRTGRCWMFAGLNLIRSETRNELNLKEFEFSQSYLMFWDKLERANFILEAIIETAHLPVDDRTVAWLLQRPIEDGGQWDMFVSLVNKYGLVPKTVMVETDSSSNSSRLNTMLNYQVRQGSKLIRDMYSSEAGLDELRKVKTEVVSTIFQMLCIHLGTPPSSFFWQWKDKDDEFRRDGNISPTEFADKYVKTPLDEYVCLVHDPRPTSQVGKTYTVSYLGNVLNGSPIRYLNVDIQLMKDLTAKQLEDGLPVWMGCDTGKQMDRDLGIWDAELFDYESVYDTKFSLDKASRLEYHQTSMTHAMLFTGVDMVDGKPRRWRVENSWDDKVGDKGFFMMNDSWFDEHMFEIAVPKKYLSEELQKALNLEPIILPPWDPMGALA